MKRLITIAIVLVVCAVVLAGPVLTYHTMKVEVLDTDWEWFKTGFLKKCPVPLEPPTKGAEPEPIMDANDWVEFRTALWAQGQAIQGNKEILAEEAAKQEQKKDYVKQVKDRR